MCFEIILLFELPISVTNQQVAIFLCKPVSSRRDILRCCMDCFVPCLSYQIYNASANLPLSNLFQASKSVIHVLQLLLLLSETALHFIDFVQLGQNGSRRLPCTWSNTKVLSATCHQTGQHGEMRGTIGTSIVLRQSAFAQSWKGEDGLHGKEVAGSWGARTMPMGKIFCCQNSSPAFLSVTTLQSEMPCLRP